MTSTKKAAITSLCIALCYVLPLVFHATASGALFAPMHFPILLCGLICGPFYGAFCGIAGPLVSSILSGMPAVARLIYFVPETITYGLCTGLFMKWIRTGYLTRDLYCSLIPSMLLGRVVGGLSEALFYLSEMDQPFTIKLWAASYFVGSTPGIILQLAILPSLVIALERAKLIEKRYAKEANK